MVSQRTNRIEGFGAFVDSWQDPAHPENRTRAIPRSTPYGNVNVTGQLGDYRGYVLSRWHPRFGDALEPGIRDLVFVLIEQFHWVTYSSCEGHHYGRLMHAPVERMVGVCPRSPAELNAVRTTLNAVRGHINRRHHGSCVRLAVITDRLDTDGGGRTAVDLVFRRRQRARWTTYFRDLEGVYANTVTALARLSTRGQA